MRLVGLMTLLSLCACPSPTTPDGGTGDAGPREDSGVPVVDSGSPLPPLSWDGGCTPLGSRFCAVNPLPWPAGINAIDATAEDDVWFVGDGRLIAHYDGNEVRVVELEGNRPDSFMKIDARRRDCAWAAGVSAVAKWDGQKWSYVADPPDIVERLVAPDCDHPLVLSQSRTIYRWDGSEWQTFVTATQVGLDNLSNFAAEGSQLWVTGGAVAGGMGVMKVFELTDAGFADRTPTAPDPELYPLDQMIIQSDGGLLAFRGGYFQFNWEGGHWTRTELTPMAPGEQFGVDARGQIYALLLSNVATMDGGTVTPLGPPLYRPVLGGDLRFFSLAVTPNGELWVGGEKGGLAHYRNGAWRVFSEGPIWSRNTGAQVGDEVWTIGGLGLTVLNRNGVVWRDLQPPNSTCEYFAIDVAAPDDVWLAGYEFNSARPILHWDGQSFTGEMIPNGLHRAPSLLRVGDTRWAVSRNIRVPTATGVYAREANGTWSELQQGADGAFSFGWSDGAQVITVGNEGGRRTQRYVNSTWGAPVKEPGATLLNALAGPDVSHLYAVGDRTLHRFDDGGWTVLGTLTDGVRLNALAVRGDDIYATGERFHEGLAVGTAATLVHWRVGGAAEEQLVPGVASASGLFFTGDTLWLVGVDGAIIKVVTP